MIRTKGEAGTGKSFREKVFTVSGSQANPKHANLIGDHPYMTSRKLGEEGCQFCDAMYEGLSKQSF